MLAKRKKYYREYLQTRSQLHRQNHKKVQKEIREFLRNMENDWWEKQSTEMEQLSAQGNSHEYYKAINSLWSTAVKKDLSNISQKRWIVHKLGQRIS